MNRNAVISSAVCGLICAAGFLLPGTVLSLRDAAVSKRVETVDVEEVELKLVSELSDAEKLKLVGTETAARVPLKSGRELDGETAAKNVSKYIAEMGNGSAGYDVSETEPVLYVGFDGSSIVVWEVALEDSYSKIRALVDDETGHLLGYRLACYPYGYGEAEKLMAAQGVRWPEVDPEYGPTAPSERDQQYGPAQEASPGAMGEKEEADGYPSSAAVGNDPAPDGSFSAASHEINYILEADRFLDQFGLKSIGTVIDGYYTILANLGSSSFVPVTIWVGEGYRETFYSVNMGTTQ